MNVRKLVTICKWQEINVKSQGSITKHLSCDMLLYYKFIIQFFAGKRILKIGEQLAKLQTKWLTVSCTSFALHVFIKYAGLAT